MSMRLVALAVAVFAEGLMAQAGASKSAPVRVEGGLVQGVVEHGLAVYRGIPFAAPPTGDLRWRPPAPAASWQGVRKADKFAAGCMQEAVWASVVGEAEMPFSEDCLYLNIWSPAQSPKERLAVMVWIYGGGFLSGFTSLPLYSGENLAGKGVVVVSIAYRVGPLGFLAHRELSAESGGHGSGNYGLLDQIAALGWVKRNIAAFGGDPNRVTIFGESAGGESVSMLAASPLAKGLFQGVICESGGSFAPARVDDEGGENILQSAAAESRGAETLKSLGVQTIAEARKLPAKAVSAAGGGILDRFWPVLDGYAIVDDQYKLYRAGKYNDTPVLVGTNSNEGFIWLHSTTPEAYTAFVTKRFGAFAPAIFAVYPASPEQALRSHQDVYRETGFAWGTWAWAHLQSRTGKGKVFVYYFNHRPPYPNTPEYQTAGASHGDELDYVFGRQEPGQLPWTPTDRKLSDAIISFWVNFAKTGNPNGPGLPQWPAFRADHPMAMHFNDQPQAGAYPNLQKVEFWEKYYAWRRGEASPPGSDGSGR
jgi:para-nitrobenzyl esterase